MAVGVRHERQAPCPGQGDGRPIEVDVPGVEVGELDGVEEIDLAEQATAEREGGREERVRRDHQPLRPFVAPEIGERAQHRERDVDVVEQDVAALDGGLDAGDQENASLGGVVRERLPRRQQIVIGDAEDVVPRAGGAVHEAVGVVGDERVAFPRVQVQVGLEHAHSTVTLLARLRG